MEREVGKLKEEHFTRGCATKILYPFHYSRSRAKFSLVTSLTYTH